MIPYNPHTPQEEQSMLSTIGVPSIDALFEDIKPHQRPKVFDLPQGQAEMDVLAYFTQLSKKNVSDLTLFVGGGYYDHYIPAAVDSIVSRGEFYTAYTPYQPECSQGTLQALYEFQSALCTLTAMEVANASLYDGATALYEATMMAFRLTRRRKILIDGALNPIYKKIIETYTSNLSYEFQEVLVTHGQTDRIHLFEALDDQVAAVIVQNPNFFGAIDDHSDIVGNAHEVGALVIQSVYPMALGLMKPPGDMGVDIVVGEGQSLGLPLNFGGPYLGFMATRKKYIRKMPGRIIGKTVDQQGRECFVNTLQAREQHIRREKATSNICTNVSLCALQATVYMTLVGKQGFKELAQLNLDKADFARQEINKIKGVEVKQSSPTFNEFTVHLPQPAVEVIEAMIDQGFAAGFPLGRYYPGMENYMIVAVTEKRTKDEILAYAKSLEQVLWP